MKTFLARHHVPYRWPDIDRDDEATRLVRAYDDVPVIDAAAAELNQVWTNLLTNALDAMDGSGRLTVVTRPHGDGVEVEVIDTGSGLTPQAREHAFEPFFTTEGVGQGTGLGLDICRRIVVDRHGGTSDIEPQAQGALLRARLPARPEG